jgi:hypothetical protein
MNAYLSSIFKNALIVKIDKAQQAPRYIRISGHLLTVLFKNGTRLAGTGSQQGFSQTARRTYIE